MEDTKKHIHTLNEENKTHRLKNEDEVTKSNESNIFSDFLLYFSDDEKAIYQGRPRLTSEFADAYAQEFQIYFEEDKIKLVNLYDSCRVHFKTAEDSDKNSWVTAKEMTFEYLDGKLKLCDAQINVESYFDQDKTETRDLVINEASGQHLILKISEDEKIESIQMMQNIKGVYKFIKK